MSERLAHMYLIVRRKAVEKLEAWDRSIGSDPDKVRIEAIDLVEHLRALLACTSGPGCNICATEATRTTLIELETGRH